jgi:DNA-directed RNA polymerase subunit RPC12/RpoP
MNVIRFACPACGQHIACGPGAKGTQIQCPACNQTVIVPDALLGVPLSPADSTVQAPPVLAPPPAAASALAPPPQGKGDKPTLAWLCEECGSEFLASYDEYGKSIECSYCHQDTKVVRQSSRRREGHEPTKAQSGERKETPVVRLVVGVAVGAIVCAGILGIWHYRSEINKAEKLELGKLEARRDKGLLSESSGAGGFEEKAQQGREPTPQDFARNAKESGRGEELLRILSAVEKMVGGSEATLALYHFWAVDLSEGRLSRAQYVSNLTGNIEPITAFTEGVKGLQDWRNEFPELSPLIGRLIEGHAKIREGYLLSASAPKQPREVNTSQGDQKIEEAGRLVDQCRREVKALIESLR